MQEIVHVPVLLKEVLEALFPGGTASSGKQKEKEHFVDGTVGQGGHAEAILTRASPDGRLLAIDRDERNLSVAKKRLAPFGQRAVFAHGSYSQAAAIAAREGFRDVRGVLLDLGFSSAHIEDPSRGFSFQSEGPLDMRYDTSQALSAEVAVNEWSQEELSDIFRVYGEDRHAAYLARAIVAARKEQRIVTTAQLANVIIEALGGRRGKIHPATQVFQALRIAVNDELGELERALPDLISLLAPGGRIAIITFHSLEDRLVKKYFASHEAEIKNLTKHVIKPSAEEILRNPRARSAKLRVAERI